MRKEGGFKSLPASVRKGLEKSLASEKPFLLSPLNWLAGKAFGKKKVDKAYWKYFQSPIVKADVAAGSAAKKLQQKLIGGKGKLWTETKILETGKRKGLATGKQEYEVPSILAPASKASKFVLPLLGAIKLDEIRQEKTAMDTNKITRAHLEKTAQMMVALKDERNQLKKEAKAAELLYKQAELGQISLPKTHAEFKEKVASLLRKDLNVVEEAIKMASSSEELSSFGSLDSASSTGVNGMSPTNDFARAIIEN